MLTIYIGANKNYGQKSEFQDNVELVVLCISYIFGDICDNKNVQTNKAFDFEF
jgi:hypothetical protein